MGNKHTWVYVTTGPAPDAVDVIVIKAPADLLPPPELEFYRVLRGPQMFYYAPGEARQVDNA